MHVVTREGRVLLLRLQGIGFRPRDAAMLVDLWEAGRPTRDLLESAAALGYGPAAALEAALADLRTREDLEGY